jgi:hypothetical protein
LSFIAEAGLGLWLLLKGVKDVGDEPALAEPARSQ